MTNKDIDNFKVIYYENLIRSLIQELASEREKALKIDAFLLELNNCGCENANCESRVWANRISHRMECKND